MQAIEGAAKGVGLGLAFLKHLERSKVLVYVIDMAGTDNREPWTDYKILKKEIDEYSAELAERPYLVVANKLDKCKKSEIAGNLDCIRATLALPQDCLLIPFSAEKGDGRDALIREILRCCGE